LTNFVNFFVVGATGFVRLTFFYRQACT